MVEPTTISIITRCLSEAVIIRSDEYRNGFLYQQFYFDMIAKYSLIIRKYTFYVK